MSRLGEQARKHRLVVELVSLAVALAAGIGIGAALWAGGSTQTSSSAPTTSTVPAGLPRHHGVRGQITAQNGDTWTVTTLAGRTVTVLLTPDTRFGTANDPAKRSQFTVGSSVTVAGTRSGSTITATRVFTLVRGRAGSGTTSTLAPADAGVGASAPVTADPPVARFTGSSTEGPSSVMDWLPTVRA